MKIVKEMTAQGFRDYVASIQSCGDHPLPNLTDEVLASVVEIIGAHVEEAETYEDTEGKVLVRLADGTYGIFREWSDSSGHG